MTGVACCQVELTPPKAKIGTLIGPSLQLLQGVPKADESPAIGLIHRLGRDLPAEQLVQNVAHFVPAMLDRLGVKLQ